MDLETVKAWENVPGAILPVKDDDPQNDYAWLDAVDEDNCYMALELSNSRPSKSLDFGRDGFTGSLSLWHELLQITAPDSQCGLTFVRGDFPDNPDSILARAQRRNQKGTFGLGISIPENADWVQEPTPAQAMINLRWPCTRLNWVRKDKLLGSVHFASYTACSFVKDGTVYQIARITPKKLSTSLPSTGSGSDCGSPHEDTGHRVTYAVDVGGVIRFGCPSSAASRVSSSDPTPTPVPPPFYDRYTKTPDDGQPGYVVTCTSAVHDKRLEVRVWIDREPLRLSLHPCKSPRLQHGCHPQEYPDEVCSLHVRHQLALHEGRPTVIVASFSLVDSQTPLMTDSRPVIDYEEVQDYLGVADTSLSAPYRLWSALLSLSETPDGFELDAIGRAVESVLGVASLPVAYSGETNAGQHQDGVSPPSAGVALVKNIVTPQVVDLESAFWQVRLLVKAVNLLKTELQIEGYDIKDKHYQQAQHIYRDSIADRLREICYWVLHIVQPISKKGGLQDPKLGILASDVLPSPEIRRKCKPQYPTEDDSESSGRCWRKQMRLQSTAVGIQKYYCTMIIWYVMAQLPEALEDPRWWSDLWKRLPDFEFLTSQDKIGFVAVDDPNGCLIRWYHNCSLSKICETLQAQDEDGFNERYQIDISQIRKRARDWQIKAEKSMRLFNQGRLAGRTLGHELANLAVLASELRIDDKAITTAGKSCLQLAQDLIRRRQPTSTLNAGRSGVLRWDSKHDIRSAKPRPAPWELSCLAQHAPLNLGIEGSRENCLDAVGQFMLTDYTFMGSWDYSKTTVGQWWDFVTSSIICAKLLEEEAGAGSKKQRGEGGENHTNNLPRVVSNAAIAMPLHPADAAPREHHDKTLDREQLEMLGKIYAFHKENAKAPAGPVFDWKHRKPRMLYHEDATVQSLEDTPGVYGIKQKANVGIRSNVSQYLESNALPEPDWTLDTIKARVGPSKLHHLSCFDFYLTADCNDSPEISEAAARGRANWSFWTNWAKEKDGWPRQELLDHFAADAGLMDLYLIGQPDEHPNMKTYSGPVQNLLKNEGIRETLLAEYQESLFLALNDSMVDQGVKYRMIFAKRLSPATMQAMVYMWHPDAIDTFDDHEGDLSNFNDTINQCFTGSEDTWVTTITLKHWRLQDELESKIRRAEKAMDDQEKKLRKELREQQKEERRRRKKKDQNAIRDEDQPVKGDFPPLNVADHDSRRRRRQQLSKIHELALSMVITGDERGRSWTCTVVCELFDEAAMARYAAEAATILQMFIHQQYTGRILVFLLLLGHMCERLAEECDHFIKELDAIMELNPRVLLEGMEWHKSDVALKKLKQMLWGFEALRVFGDKLAKALAETDRAEASMRSWLDRMGAQNRHKDMIRGMELVQEEFDKRHSRLKNAHSSIQQRIDQGTKLREGISSVLGVEQNENISMLTWLTIVYLPPAFIASVFGMGHDIVSEQAGWSTFGWLLAVFLFATVMFALSLRIVIEQLRKLEKLAFGLVRTPRKFTAFQAPSEG